VKQVEEAVEVLRRSRLRAMALARASVCKFASGFRIPNRARVSESATDPRRGMEAAGEKEMAAVAARAKEEAEEVVVVRVTAAARTARNERWSVTGV
jgi:hypothetical protein